MTDLMGIVREACRNKKLDIPELKTLEGAAALSKCMDRMTGAEGEGYDYEKAGYAAAALMKWTDSLPLDVFRGDNVGIPAVMERIRKIYDGSFFQEEHRFPLAYTDYYGCTTHAFVRFVNERRNAWKLPYNYEKIKAMQDNGYSFDWYSYPSNAIGTHPEAPWCEYLRLFPQKSEDLVYDAIHTKRRDILECMKELGALSEEKVSEIMSSSVEGTREFFRSVWYERQEDAPEISMVEGLLPEADRLVAEKDAFLRLTREERLKSTVDYQGIEDELWKIEGKICKIVSGSFAIFRAERELVKRALVHAPVILLSGEWSSDRELYEIAFDRAEQIYVREKGGSWYSTDLASSNKKEQKDVRLNAFKRLYPTDEEKRAFLKAHPTCAILGGFHGACSKKIREDLAFWTEIYVRAAEDVRPDLPTALKKNQAFLKICEPAKHIADFEKFYTYEDDGDLEFALAQRKVRILLPAVPEALKTRENICRILEHNTRRSSYEVRYSYDELDITLFSDEEFVVGAAAYEIEPREFFRRIEKPLRKAERVWKAWGTKERIGMIWSEIPMAVKKTRAFAEHLLAIGAGVSQEGSVFAEMWKAFPDLSEALEDAYGKELKEEVDQFGRPMDPRDIERRVGNLPDEKLREAVSRKLFGAAKK